MDTEPDFDPLAGASDEALRWLVAATTRQFEDAMLAWERTQAGITTGQQYPREKYNKGWEPTPEEIQAACQEIQQSWDADEFLRRSGRNPDNAWQPPRTRSSGRSVPEGRWDG